MKIAITARDFSGVDDSALQMLINAGHLVLDYSSSNMGSGADVAEIIRAVGDADIAVTGLEPYGQELLQGCPNLKMISRRGIGYDSVDIEACRRHGVRVARTVGAVEGAVAEHVMAYILYFSRRIDMQNADMQKGLWNRVMTPGAKTRRLGLVGFGGIGKEIARRALPFGMEILYNCRHPQPQWEEEYGVSYAPLDRLLSTCDYVSVNVPLTDDTRGMFGHAMLSKMKKGSVFINIARSGVMDVMALKELLQNGHLGGAAVDVFDCEPCTDSPLIGCPNTILTPHTAPYTDENFITLNRMAAQNVLDFIDGRLDAKNIVV